MSEDYDKSWQAGLNGTGPNATTNWDAYQAGKSIRDLNQAELARQNQAWSQAQPTASFDAFSPAAPQTWTPPVYAAGGGGGVAGGGGAIAPFRAPMAIAVGFFLLLGGFSLMPLIYPIAGIVSLTVAAAGGYAAFLANASGLTAIIGVVALIVFWFLSRVEHRLAVRRGYRQARHVWRLLAFAAVADVWLMKSAIQQGTIRVHDLTRAFAHWGNLLVVVVLAGLAHLLLRSKRLRKTWHLGLEGLRLRPTDLDADCK